MVKNLTKALLPILLFCVFFAASCNIDFLGFFASSDLDERLAERDNFRFLTNSDRRPQFGNEYQFLVFTDTHIEDGNTFDLEKLSDVFENNSQIKFAVALGDITNYGSEQDIKKFIDIAEMFNVPCYPVIGNHDVYFGNWSAWKEQIGSTNYRIDGDGTTLFILDTANSFFGKEQLDRLERELKGVGGHVFIFTHSNLFVTGPVNMQQITDTKERARIISILRNKCDIMFMGHLHKRLINETGNVRYINIEDFNSTHTYCLVSVKNSGVTYTFEKLF
jgi:predicted phosphodiesterase